MVVPSDLTFSLPPSPLTRHMHTAGMWSMLYPLGAGPVCVTVPTSDPLVFYMGADGRLSMTWELCAAGQQGSACPSNPPVPSLIDTCHASKGVVVNSVLCGQEQQIGTHHLPQQLRSLSPRVHHRPHRFPLASSLSLVTLKPLWDLVSKGVV